MALGLGYFFLDGALEAVRDWLESAALLHHAWNWLDTVGMGQLKTVLAPLIVIFAVTPLIVVGSLLLVSTFMTPTLLARWWPSGAFRHWSASAAARFEKPGLVAGLHRAGLAGLGGIHPAVVCAATDPGAASSSGAG